MSVRVTQLPQRDGVVETPIRVVAMSEVGPTVYAHGLVAYPTGEITRGGGPTQQPTIADLTPDPADPAIGDPTQADVIQASLKPGEVTTGTYRRRRGA